MRQFTNNEKIILDFLIKNTGKWFAPSAIARKADKKEHTCSWASHICLRLTNFGIIKHNSAGGYCYNAGTLGKEWVTESGYILSLKPLEPVRDKEFSKDIHTKFHRNIDILTCTKAQNKKILRPLKPETTEIDLTCSNGDLYTISTLVNGLQIKKQSNNDEKISISTCKGDRIIIGDSIVYIY